MEKIVLHVSEELLDAFHIERKVFFETIARKAKGKGNLILSDTVKKLQIDKLMDRCLFLAKEYSEENSVLLYCKTIELLSLFKNLIVDTDEVNTNTHSSNKTVNKIIDYLNRHYNEEMTLDLLAERFHFSKYYLSHLFKEYVGISPGDYLIVRRLYVANNLIRGGVSVKEASLTVGFNNYSNFFRLYKKYFKITPQQFKEQLKN